MPRYVCIHGHFYQPPRESPWTGKIENQPSAAPFPNWNYRINQECYDANSKSPILGADGTPVRYLNNYGFISYNFGPTLLRWMDTYNPQTVKCLVEADKKSIERFGHGCAVAQVYHHAILPLCNEQDKHTEVAWGIADFEYRYKRKPQGIWLAETAADTATLEVLASHGIQFTILAPEQCKQTRPLGWKEWQKTEDTDTTQPYLILLPSGKKITVFFYHGDLAQDVAFRGALDNGEDFGKRIAKVARSHGEGRLTHYATDGESYGHHHRYGDIALAYCLKSLVEEEDIYLTNYASYLAEHPAVMEAQIHEPSSWSCAHGVGRWSDNCGCVIDPRNAGKQQWRKVLREALNWLRDRFVEDYLQITSTLVKDPWLLRHGLYRAEMNNTVDQWLDTQAEKPLSAKQRTQIKERLEIQRQALQMFTSCGWFFDDPAGLEPVQILRYAAKAIALYKEASSIDLTEPFVSKLAAMRGLKPQYPTGTVIWEELIAPTVP